MERQTYHWCSKHGKWVTTHKDSECLGINASPAEFKSNKKKRKKADGINVAFKTDSENDSDNNEGDEGEKHEVKVDKALMSFVREASDMV
jgi:hypothetical protein